MSYGKKDEDSDFGLVKVDRTQVFQEGKPRANCNRLSPTGAVLNGGQHDYSIAPLSNREDAEFF